MPSQAMPCYAVPCHRPGGGCHVRPVAPPTLVHGIALPRFIRRVQVSFPHCILRRHLHGMPRLFLLVARKALCAASHAAGQLSAAGAPGVGTAASGRCAGRPRRNSLAPQRRKGSGRSRLACRTSPRQLVSRWAGAPQWHGQGSAAPQAVRPGGGSATPIPQPTGTGIHHLCCTLRAGCRPETRPRPRHSAPGRLRSTQELGAGAVMQCLEVHDVAEGCPGKACAAGSAIVIHASGTDHPGPATPHRYGPVVSRTSTGAPSAASSSRRPSASRPRPERILRAQGSISPKQAAARTAASKQTPSEAISLAPAGL